MTTGKDGVSSGGAVRRRDFLALVTAGAASTLTGFAQSAHQGKAPKRAAVASGSARSPEDKKARVDVQWDKSIRVSTTYPSLLYVGTPLSNADSPQREPILRAIRDLKADYVRCAPCNDYPHLAIAELQPPGKDSTSWDFSYVDQMMVDAIKAVDGRPFIFNFSTIPEWMFKTPKPIEYPANPNELFFDYEQGTELRDPTYREVADYFARVVSWYVNGGFTDELGKWHESGHHFKVDYWEVLNETNVEHQMSPEVYTGLYDAVVEAVRKVSPETKFIGLVNSFPFSSSKSFDYFLDHSHHKPGIPLDAVSFHFYTGTEDASESLADDPYTFFAQADSFLWIVDYIETMRQRLSPETRLMVDELGNGLPGDGPKWNPKYSSIPAVYWNLCAAFYAYVFAGLALRGVEVATLSMLPSYPGQFPDIAMLNWENGEPNARYLALKLIRDHCLPGDRIVQSSAGSGYLLAQGYVSPSGERKLLLVNKCQEDFLIEMPEAQGSRLEIVDVRTPPNSTRVTTVEGPTFELGGFGVAALTLRA